MKWLGVDFDGTICKTKPPKFEMGKIVKGAKETLDFLTKKGWKIIIYTSRSWADYCNIELWCQDNELPVSQIVCGKILVRYFIDDKAIEFKNWKSIEKRFK